MTQVIDLKKWQKKLANNSKSDAKSKQASPSVQAGQIRTDLLPEKSDELNTMIPLQVSEIPIDKTTLELVIVAEQAWQKPFKLNSAFARKYSFGVSIACQVGWISTEVSEDVFTKTWRITEPGMHFLNDFNAQHAPHITEALKRVLEGKNDKPSNTK